MNYTANDVASHFQKYSDHISHYAVMQTKLRSANKSQKTLDSYVEKTNKNLHYALQVFEAKIHDGHINRARRKPEIYKPLSFATIEGAYETTNNELTVHVNLLLGNLPALSDSITSPIVIRLNSMSYDPSWEKVQLKLDTLQSKPS